MPSLLPSLLPFVLQSHLLRALRPDTTVSDIFEKREKRFLRRWAPFFLLGAFFQDQHCFPEGRFSRFRLRSHHDVGRIASAGAVVARLQLRLRCVEAVRARGGGSQGLIDWRAAGWCRAADGRREAPCQGCRPAVVAFKEQFPLGGVTLDGIFASHQAHVSQLLQHVDRL